MAPGSPHLAAAQKVAVAASCAALLMFGALIYNGAPQRQPLTAVANPSIERTEVVVSSDSSDHDTGTGDAASETTDNESDEQASDDSETKVRRAVTDLIREKSPNAKVEGVFLLGFGRDSNLYLAGADTTSAEGRRNIDCLVRQYVRRNGTTYWRAESLSREEAAAMEQKIATLPSEEGDDSGNTP